MVVPIMCQLHSTEKRFAHQIYELNLKQFKYDIVPPANNKAHKSNLSLEILAYNFVHFSKSTKILDFIKSKEPETVLKWPDNFNLLSESKYLGDDTLSKFFQKLVSSRTFKAKDILHLPVTISVRWKGLARDLLQIFLLKPLMLKYLPDFEIKDQKSKSYADHFINILKDISDASILAVFDLSVAHITAFILTASNFNFMSLTIKITKLFAEVAKKHNLASEKVLKGLHRHLYQADGYFAVLDDDPDIADGVQACLERSISNRYKVSIPFEQQKLSLFTLDKLCDLKFNDFLDSDYERRVQTSPFLVLLEFFSKEELKTWLVRDNSTCERLVFEATKGKNSSGTVPLPNNVVIEKAIEDIQVRQSVRNSRKRVKNTNINLSDKKRAKKA